MKDSGIEWIGCIPEVWNIRLSKYCFDSHKYIVGMREEDYERLALTLFGVVKRSKDDNEGLQPSSFYTYQIVKPNELIFKLIDLQNVSTSRVGLSHDTGIVSPAYIVLSCHDDICPSYAEKFFLSLWNRQIFNHLGDEGVRSSLNVGDLLKIPFICPPLEIQKAISSFLDSKCTDIDTLKGDILTQIETLEKYKRSVIREAVTKGLDKSAEMKNSGIDWVGAIRSTWRVQPLYLYFDERKRLNSLGKETNLLSLSYGHVVRKDINTVEGLLPASFNTYNIVEVDDIIIRPTDLQNDKKSLRTGLVTEHGIITSAYIALRPIADIDVRYFHYLLHAYDVMKVFYNMGDGVRQSMNFKEFSRLMVLEPTKEEQHAIADYLDDICSQVDAIIADKKAQLDTLDEYKKSLIYEYVTGKKEVPVA